MFLCAGTIFHCQQQTGMFLCGGTIFHCQQQACFCVLEQSFTASNKQACFCVLENKQFHWFWVGRSWTVGIHMGITITINAKARWPSGSLSDSTGLLHPGSYKLLTPKFSNFLFLQNWKTNFIDYPPNNLYSRVIYTYTYTHHSDSNVMPFHNHNYPSFLDQVRWVRHTCLNKRSIGGNIWRLMDGQWNQREKILVCGSSGENFLVRVTSVCGVFVCDCLFSQPGVIGDKWRVHLNFFF